MPQVTGPLTTTATTDVFGTHDAYYGIDGLRSVVTKAARNAIPTERRREGMMVYTQDDKKYYTLNASPWAGTDADWTVLGTGSSAAPSASQQFDFPTAQADWTMNHTLGAKPTVTTYDLNWNEIQGNVSSPTDTQVIVHHDVRGGQAGHAILRTRG